MKKLFSKTVTIENNKSKEETITVFNQHIEPFHKDSSKLKFEGRISLEGKFNIKIADVVKMGRTAIYPIEISGSVFETVSGGSIIEFTISDSKTSLIFRCISIPFFLIISVILYTKVLKIEPPVPWFLPIFFMVMGLLIYYFLFHYESNKAIKYWQKVLS
ncbi:hypothetical protein [Flavobacterium cerinum]|uniref:Uncharacterized protein n=1 Tax=Flavobacterium cerinum TaxID=2502784 RepID=A0A3S3Q8B1_9FLAO|nr:hypothetical protein [Flavobacterium cerinum]RWW99612.1 hypothetical protein EPI11_11715 [Flavobacterium cerinum]